MSSLLFVLFTRAKNAQKAWGRPHVRQVALRLGRLHSKRANERGLPTSSRPITALAAISWSNGRPSSPLNPAPSAKSLLRYVGGAAGPRSATPTLPLGSGRRIPASAGSRGVPGARNGHSPPHGPWRRAISAHRFQRGRIRDSCLERPNLRRPRAPLRSAVAPWPAHSAKCGPQPG